MLKRLAEGTMIGVGIVLIVGVVFAIAWAGDVFTVDKDGTLKFAVNDQGKITVGATESYVNLVIQNNAAVANNKVDVTADVLTVEGIRLESVNVAADLTLSGAGGLDAGGEAANTWYYVWVVTNNNGTSSNGLLSASSTSPTLPSGYTKKRRVGAVRNDGSSNFLRFIQEGNKALYTGDVSVNNRALFGGTSTTWASVSLTSYIPPTSRRANIRLISYVTHNSANIPFHVSVKEKGTGSGSYGTWTVNNITNVANSLHANQDLVEIPTSTAQEIEYRIENVPSTSGGAYIDINGYSDRI